MSKKQQYKVIVIMYIVINLFQKVDKVCKMIPNNAKNNANNTLITCKMCIVILA